MRDANNDVHDHSDNDNSVNIALGPLGRMQFHLTRGDALSVSNDLYHDDLDCNRDTHINNTNDDHKHYNNSDGMQLFRGSHVQPRVGASNVC